MADPSVSPSRTHELLELILEQLQEHTEEIRVQNVLLERIANSKHVWNSPAPDEAGNDGDMAPILLALADSMDDWQHLPFSTEEVIAHSEEHYGLAEALKAARCTTVPTLGARFRDRKGKPFNGLRIVRDGRAWRLERC